MSHGTESVSKEGRPPVEAIIPIILAAGDSTRMGYPKALLPLHGDSFIGRIVRNLRNLDLPEPLAVLGRDADRIRKLPELQSLQTVVNPAPERGQLSSIQLGLRHLTEPCAGCLLWPVDHPAVSRNLVRDMVHLFRTSGAPLVLPRCGGRRGHPAIFSSMLFGEILEAPEHEGARSVVLRHQKRIALMETPETATVTDIDTPDDYFRLTGIPLAEAIASLKSRFGMAP